VQLHGFLRATFDIDLALALDDANLVRFIAVAKHFCLIPALPVDMETLRDARLIEQGYCEKGMLSFSLREPQVGGSVVDVRVRPEVPFSTLASNAVIGELFGRQVPIAAIADLLVMKRIANRPKDRIDILVLEKIAREEYPNA